MAISAKDQLKHVADSLSEAEAEMCLSTIELYAICRDLVALVDGNRRQYQYDTELNRIVERARAALPGGE